MSIYIYFCHGFESTNVSANVNRGCVTPKLISNMVQSLEDDGNATEDIDGFDEISSEFQDKVRGALEQGHVDDADWKGVSFSPVFI